MQPRPCLNLGKKKILSPTPQKELEALHSSCPSQMWGQEPSQIIPEQAGCTSCTSKQEPFHTKTSGVGSCWEVLWLQGHFQRLRVDFMAAQDRDVGSEDGGAEGMQTWRDQVGGAALGNILFAFFLHLNEVWVGKNKLLFCGENKPLFCGENEPSFCGEKPLPGSQPPQPHLEHLLWHGLGPLPGHRDLGVGIEEDFNDFRHSSTGFQHLARDSGRAQRGATSPCCSQVCRTPPRSRLGQP